ncbi:ABC transporter ATP-binding protein [bacterium]|nr:ABC transporter ATP-binding protein [bacterium]
MKPILKLENVSYRYQDAKEDEFVLKNINFEFEQGKIYAIKGKSGSGKTTLLSLISGLEKCNKGTILYEGKDLSKMDLDRYRSKEIGIVFQSYNLLPHLTVEENIILSMDINHTKNKNASFYLEKVGLPSSYGNRKILKLSGGEQQRVAIARSLSYNPKMIIADEPTGNLDCETEDEILNIFKNLAQKENKCIIIVTHSKNVCDQADIVYELKKSS